jgi:hypothetical protein
LSIPTAAAAIWRDEKAAMRRIEVGFEDGCGFSPAKMNVSHAETKISDNPARREIC